jgi:hypothetical protein
VELVGQLRARGERRVTYFDVLEYARGQDLLESPRIRCEFELASRVRELR